MKIPVACEPCELWGHIAQPEDGVAVQCPMCPGLLSALDEKQRLPAGPMDERGEPRRVVKTILRQAEKTPFGESSVSRRITALRAPPRVVVVCPVCAYKNRIPADHDGRAVKCTRCGHSFRPPLVFEPDDGLTKQFTGRKPPARINQSARRRLERRRRRALRRRLINLSVGGLLCGWGLWLRAQERAYTASLSAQHDRTARGVDGIAASPGASADSLHGSILDNPFFARARLDGLTGNGMAVLQEAVHLASGETPRTDEGTQGGYAGPAVQELTEVLLNASVPELAWLSDVIVYAQTAAASPTEAQTPGPRPAATPAPGIGDPEPRSTSATPPVISRAGAARRVAEQLVSLPDAELSVVQDCVHHAEERVQAREAGRPMDELPLAEQARREALALGAQIDAFWLAAEYELRTEIASNHVQYLARKGVQPHDLDAHARAAIQLTQDLDGPGLRAGTPEAVALLRDLSDAIGRGRVEFVHVSAQEHAYALRAAARLVAQRCGTGQEAAVRALGATLVAVPTERSYSDVPQFDARDPNYFAEGQLLPGWYEAVAADTACLE